MDNYVLKAIPTIIKFTSRASTKIRDQYYTFEYGEERQINNFEEVDIEKERQLLNNLFHRYPDRTFIVISHRFHNQDLFNKKYRIESGVSYEEWLDFGRLSVNTG